jgi:hypothetical protein
MTLFKNGRPFLKMTIEKTIFKNDHKVAATQVKNMNIFKNGRPASAIGEVDDNSLQTQERSETDPMSGITTEEQETQFIAALGGIPPKKTAAEMEDLKKTSCYAYVKGNCKSSTCLRSHDKKIIVACLEEDLQRAKQLP